MSEAKKPPLPANALTDDEQRQLVELIMRSITERYDGELECWADSYDGGPVYTPIDTDEIREMLVALWGERVSAEELDEAFYWLTRDRNHWPHARCQADEDERRLSDLATDEERAELARYLRSEFGPDEDDVRG
jgi:hypothetical protein